MPPRSSSMERKSVTVRVPATSANMGPGYDSLGMAVEIWNELTVERASEYSMTIEGEGADELPTQEEGNLVCIGLKAVFEHAGDGGETRAEFHKQRRFAHASLPFIHSPLAASYRAATSKAARVASINLARCSVRGWRARCRRTRH